MTDNNANTMDEPQMMMLLLVNGFSPSDLQASLSSLQSQTKNLGTHKQRQAYWEAYERIQKDLNKYSDMDVDGGKLYGLVKYYSTAATASDNGDATNTDDEGRTEFEPFTDRQKALVQTPRLMMGRHIKLMVDANDSNHGGDDDNVSGKEFFMPWLGHDEAQAAYDDITAGEPCISIDADRGLFISTRLKRKHCVTNVPSTVLKSMDALVSYIRQDLQPDRPLQSLDWHSHAPPRVTPYNVILTGVWPTTVTHHLDSDLAVHVPTTSMHEIYDTFLRRRNVHYIQEAEALIARMLTEIAKSNNNNDAADDATSVHSGSVRDLATAKRNALLKRVYIDASKHKFIHNARDEAAAGAFELIVVHSRPAERAGKFEEYGGVVFETFYKLDLSVFG